MTRILRPIASQKIRAKGIPMSQIVSPLVLADRNSSGQSRRRSRERSATRLDGNVTSAARTANPAIDTRHRGRLHRRDRPAASVAGGLAEVFVLRPQLLGDLAHRRDLTEHAVAHLFIDGIAERLRPGQRREAVLAARGIGEDGRKSLLGLMAGSKEDVETERAFFQDLRARGLGDPLLVVSDGAPGDHPGDRRMLPPLGAPALSGASDAHPRSVGLGGSLVYSYGGASRIGDG